MSTEALLERVKADGTIDASGVPLNSELLARIVEAAPEDPERPGRSLLETAKFDGAIFEGAASFDDVTFGGRASFIAATFEGATSFVGVTFQGPVSFSKTTFQGNAWIRNVVFEHQAVFRDATFQRDASFVEVMFKGDAWFDDATVLGDGWFFGTTVESARDFGPLVVHRALDLERTVFAQPIRIEASARALSCARAQFRGGADLLARWADVALDEADFAEPSMLAPRGGPIRDAEEELRQDLDRESEAPRVISVRRAKVAKLTIAAADMRACRFEGAHGLDQLRLEQVRFGETPSGRQRTKRWRLPTRWTRRRTIAEEHQWRSDVAGAAGWYGPEVQAAAAYEQGSESHDARLREAIEQVLVDEDADADTRGLLRELIGERFTLDEDGVPSFRRAAQPSSLESVPLAPQQIAGIYRGLRKGREDRKDEPGAADFYYGEMEMRRQQPGKQTGRPCRRASS